MAANTNAAKRIAEIREQQHLSRLLGLREAVTDLLMQLPAPVFGCLAPWPAAIGTPVQILICWRSPATKLERIDWRMQFWLRGLPMM
jgi:hypothetical protein